MSLAVYHGSLMGVRSHTPPRLCPPCGKGRAPPRSEAVLVRRAPQRVLVEVAQQYHGPTVPLHPCTTSWSPSTTSLSGLSGVAHTTATQAKGFSWYLTVKTNTSSFTASGSIVN